MIFSRFLTDSATMANDTFINQSRGHSDIIPPSDTITNFYKNSVILITGGTGFLGKVLIEKFLRVFDVRKIYILIRHKNNMNADDRLQALFNESVSMIKS